MAIADLIDKLVGAAGSGVQLKVFECTECDATFESAKQNDRASCPECLSNDVEQVGTVDR